MQVVIGFFSLLKPWLEPVGMTTTAVVAVISLWIACHVEGPPNSDAIRSVIAAEAQAAVDHDVDAAVELFISDAVVRDAGREARGEAPSTWVGRDAIRGRYADLQTFNRLSHVDITVTFEEGEHFARAIASTTGEMVRADGALDAISSVDGEIWSFRKIDGEWKIASFTYGVR